MEQEPECSHGSVRPHHERQANQGPQRATPTEAKGHQQEVRAFGRIREEGARGGARILGSSVCVCHDGGSHTAYATKAAPW